MSRAFPTIYQNIYQSLTPAQAKTLFENLTSQQVSTLVNLTSAQLQTVTQLTTTALQTLTNLTAAQVATLTGQLTVTQLQQILDTLTEPQLQQLTNALPSNSIHNLVQVLTAAQIATLVANLTPQQLNDLAKYPPATIYTLVTTLLIDDLKTLLNKPTLPPSPVAGNQNLFPSFPAIVGQPSSAPSPSFPGYAPVVVDVNTGKLWAYVNGQWKDVGAGSGGGGDVTGSGSPSRVAYWSATTELDYTSNIIVSQSGNVVVEVANTASIQLDAGGGGDISIGDTGDKVGFMGAGPSVRETVTGSTGGNAALQDLIAKLETKGLIINMTS